MSTYLLVDGFKGLLRYSLRYILCHFLIELCLQMDKRLIIVSSYNLLEDIDDFLQFLRRDGKAARLQKAQVLLSYFVVDLLETEVFIAFKYWLLVFDVMLRLFENGLIVKLSTHVAALLLQIVILGSALNGRLCGLLNLAGSRLCCCFSDY